MHVTRTAALVAVSSFLVFGSLVRAAATVTLSAPSGAVAGFSTVGDEYTWTSVTPADTATAVGVNEQGYAIASRVGSDGAPAAVTWTLASYDAHQAVFEHTFEQAGIQLRRIFSFGPADNILRIETWARSTVGANELTRLSLLSAAFSGETFQETGAANQSFPLFGNRLFVGIEHVSGECHAADENAWLGQSPHLALTNDWKFVAAIVLGWPVPNAELAAGESPVRSGFLHYLDSVRVRPHDLELHTNTWWTLPLPFSERDVVNDIEALRNGFYNRTGMFFDSYALDLGWSDRFSVWQVDEQRFPNRFNDIVARLGEMSCKLGLWVSPGSAYPEGLSNAWLRSSGYEVIEDGGPDGCTACFALGNRYQQALKDSIVGYAREFGLGHVKLDYMTNTCDVAAHGHPTGAADSRFAIDAGLADVLDSLRAVNPNIALEPLVCGYPPSPWWTMHTPFVLGPNGDDVPFGRVPCPEWSESLITARDVAYRAHQREWLMPTQCLETFDIVMQCPGNFQNMAAMAIGRGRWFISTYLKPDYMTGEDWDFLAGIVRWARANKQYLENAVMIAGSPEKREAYGYLFHAADKDIVCLRNPWIVQTTVQLPLPTNAANTRDLRMLYPRHATLARIVPGAAQPKITLAPYETVILETVPTSSKNKIVSQPARPSASIVGAAPLWRAGAAGLTHYTWNGTIAMPAVGNGEFCILVQGDDAVKDASAQVNVDGVYVAVTKNGSDGQFAAAGGPPVENWTWLRIPVAAGTHTVSVDVAVPLRSASLGMYVRGTMAAKHDLTVWSDVPFPEYRPTQKAWSQAISATKAYTLKAAVPKK